MNLFFALYTFIIIYLLITKKIVLALIVCATIPFVILIKNLIKRKKINLIKFQIAKAQENHKNNIEFKPFLNINKEPWYILELLPGISTAQAKNLAVQIKTKRKIENFEELCKIVPMNQIAQTINSKIVKF